MWHSRHIHYILIMYNPTSQGMDLPFFSKSRAKADILFLLILVDLFYSVFTRVNLNDLSMLKNKREHPLSQTCLKLFCFAQLQTWCKVVLVFLTYCLQWISNSSLFITLLWQLKLSRGGTGRRENLLLGQWDWTDM